MSAICGVFNLDGRPVAPETIEGMLTAMDYWGPDGSGVWMDGPVAMGHLMLHSTPESVGDALPRTSPDGNLILTSHARHRLGAYVTRDLCAAFPRGLMSGLFLLRFDETIVCQNGSKTTPNC